MGILNLHKFLERASSKNNLSSLRGSVIGVDAMCWLHRGSIASAWELLTGRDTDKFLRFFIKMLVLCNMCGVKPIIVFDGASLPAKAKEEDIRRQRRRENSQKAKEEIETRKISSFGQVDNKLRSMIVQSVTISPEMITRTMSVLRRLNVDFIVAPYEADAQLAYMYQEGIVSGVVSEDSDLLAFGCRRLLSKMDVNGDFVDIRLDWAFSGPEHPLKPANVGEIGKFEKWTQSMFTDLCILSGSDYKLGKIAGIGIKKAFQLLNRFRSIKRIIDSIAHARNWSKSEAEQYFEEFNYSKIAFTFHRVFDLKTFTCKFLSCNESLNPSDEILGPSIPPETAKSIMLGDVDAKSRETRVFLSKLPPGVLGVYNNSLRQSSSDGTREVAPRPDPSAQESLEAQIVAEFARSRIDESQTRELNAKYLDSLRGLILKKPTPPAIDYIVEDHEFDNIEKLLELDEDDEEKEEEEREEVGEEEEEEDVDGTAIYSPIVSPKKQVAARADVYLLGSSTPIAPPKKINPFAKKNSSIFPPSQVSRPSLTVSLAPHLVKQKDTVSADVSDLAEILKRKQLEAKTTMDSNKHQRLVTSRDVPPVKQINNFFKRRN